MSLSGADPGITKHSTRKEQDTRSTRQRHMGAHVNIDTEEREREKKRLLRRDQDKDRECSQRATKLQVALNNSITASRLPPSLLTSSPPPPCSLARFDIQIPSPLLATHNQSPLSTRPTINQSIKKPTQSHNSVINQPGLCGGPLLRAGHQIYRWPDPRTPPGRGQSALMTENGEVRQSVRTPRRRGGRGSQRSHDAPLSPEYSC